MPSPGSHTADRITLARLPSGVPIETTVHTYKGIDAGPTLYVQAAQHGREVNGCEVLRRLHDRIDPQEMRGKLVVVPVADPLTFDHVSYTTPEVLDSINPNMNRVWPGDPDGTLHSRMAARLWEYAGEADAIVDLHTGGPTMLTHVVFMEGDEDSRALAEAFGTDILLGEEAGEEADEEWGQRNFAGKLRVAATQEGIPSITPELAYNKWLVEEAIEIGLRGMENVLADLDMTDGTVEENGKKILARNHLGRVQAVTSGLFRAHPDRELGEPLRPGDPLGTLYDPATYEVLQEAEADREGILYAIAREATVTAGDSLGNVALVREE
jgi:uncharacterized protein